jgi:hypothetical protein
MLAVNIPASNPQALYTIAFAVLSVPPLNNVEAGESAACDD